MHNILQEMVCQCSQTYNKLLEMERQSSLMHFIPQKMEHLRSRTHNILK